jgi:cytoskeleton protein RodZ
MDLIEIGTALRIARESMGLTIEAVEEKTKIATSVIVALEEGNRSRFPHPVYARGFVRSYAMLLGLDAQELCAHFSHAYPVPRDTDQPEMLSPQIRVKMHDSGSVVTAVRVIAILGIVLLGALGWYAFDHYRSPSVPTSLPVEEKAVPSEEAVVGQSSQSLPAPMTQMQEVAISPDAQPETDTTSNASLETGASVAQDTPAAALPEVVEQAQPAAEPVQSAVPEQSAVSEQSAAPALEASPADASVAQQGARSMRISAHSASWLQARPDDRVLDYFLRKGESTTIAFSKSLSIKFGNAGGVKLELDGQPYPFEGALGEVKTLVVE